MKFRNFRKMLVCAGLAGGLFIAAYWLIRKFPFESTLTFVQTMASTAGLMILWAGCWALAEKFYDQWLRVPKQKREIDAYTVALVEMELERERTKSHSESELVTAMAAPPAEDGLRQP